MRRRASRSFRAFAADVLVVLALARAASAVMAAGEFTNPLTTDNTPDPGVLEHGGVYYAATTGGDGSGTYPIHSSKDLITWTRAGHVFPNNSVPAWTAGAAAGAFWAPEPHRLPSGQFAVIFCAKQKGAGRSEHSIGVVVADSPLGPYTDPIGRPLLTHPEPVGVIDPTLFVNASDGRVYLVYKIDANAVGKQTSIMAVELSPDATKVLSSEPWELIHTSEPWEGVLVEAPWVVERGGEAFLFFSGAMMDHYGVGVARAPSITHAGWIKAPQNPILAADNATGWDLVGPGHCSVLQLGGPGGEWMMWFHTWRGHQRSYNFGEPRMLSQAQVEWDAGTGWPRMADGPKPPVGPHPVPPGALE